MAQGKQECLDGVKDLENEWEEEDEGQERQSSTVLQQHFFRVGKYSKCLVTSVSCPLSEIVILEEQRCELMCQALLMWRLPGLVSRLPDVLNVNWRDHPNTRRSPARLQAPYSKVKGGFCFWGSQYIFYIDDNFGFFKFQNWVSNNTSL